MLNENALEVVYEFFEKNKYEIDMVTLPIECIEKQQGLYHRYLKFGNKSHIINLEENPQDYILSCAASFYKRNIFKQFIFNTNLHLAEDLYFNTRVFLNNPKFGIISHMEAVYYYRKRYTENSITNKNEYAENWLVNVLDCLHKSIVNDVKKTKKPLPMFIQYLFIYNIVKRINMTYFVNKEELKKFYKISEKMLESVDIETILSYNYNDYFLRTMLMMIKYKVYNIKKLAYIDSQNNICIKGNVIENVENYSFKISSIKVEDNKLYLMGYFNDIISENFKLYYKYKSELSEIKFTHINNTFLQRRFFDVILGNAYSISAEIPMRKIGEHTIILKVNNIEIPILMKNVYNDEGMLYEVSSKTEKGDVQIKIDNKSIRIILDK